MKRVYKILASSLFSNCVLYERSKAVKNEKKRKGNEKLTKAGHFPLHRLNSV